MSGFEVSNSITAEIGISSDSDCFDGTQPKFVPGEESFLEQISRLLRQWMRFWRNTELSESGRLLVLVSSSFHATECNLFESLISDEGWDEP